MSEFAGVMLASPMSVVARTQQAAVAALSRPGWTHELKADGIRALITVHATGVQIHNRRGVEITWRYPDVVEQAQTFPAGTYDGEIVCVVDGRIDFPAIHKRDAQNNAWKAQALAGSTPATFLAFDLLNLEGRDLTHQTLNVRRMELAPIGAVTLIPGTDDLPSLWSVVVTQGMEGVVSKRLDSPYVTKRSRNWIKIKQQHTVTCAVLDAVPGEGSRSGALGALRVAVFDGGEFREVARVGSGLTEAQVHETWSAGDVVEVGFLDVSPGGFLRQPVFLRRRSDVGLDACTWDQLDSVLTRQAVMR
jgi:bifunctional non-homologous end joining protein LigD